jgi:hypothetical protein
LQNNDALEIINMQAKTIEQNVITNSKNEDIKETKF